MNSWRMSLAYARRELRAGLAGFYVFLLCLVLGVGAITAVQSVAVYMSDSLHRDGRQILGGDIELRKLYKPFTAEEKNYFAKMSVAQSTIAETRAMARNADETRTSLTALQAVDKAYPLYGTAEIIDASGKPVTTPFQDLLKLKDGDWGVLVPKDLLARLGVKAGEYLFIGKTRFAIRGVFTKLPDSAASLGFIIAPNILISAEALEKTGLLEPGAPVNYEIRLALKGAGTREEMDAAEKKITADFPDAKWRIRNFYSASPRLQRYLDRLMFFLTLIGLTTLVVGGVGISSAVRAYLDTKLASIATLKCLGASGQFVFRVYMLQVLALSVLGVIAGAAIGTVAANIAGAFLTERLALSAGGGVYPQAMALAAVFGFLTTLCFSLWPVGRVIRVTPADLFRDQIAPRAKKPSSKIIFSIFLAAASMAALAVLSAPDRRMAMYFTAGTAATIGIFLVTALLVQRILRKIRIPARPEMRMAIANMSRPGNASTGALLSLGLGLTVLMTIALVEYNFSRLLKDDLSADAPSFFFLDVQPDQIQSFSKMTLAHPSSRDLHVTPQLRGRITKVNGQDAEKALVNQTYDWVVRSDRGFTYTDKLPPHSTMIAGEWWPENYKGPPLVSIASDVAKAFDIGPGDMMTTEILGEEITAKVANVREIDWASFTMNFAVTFAPGALEQMPASYIATVIIDEKDETAMQTDLAREFPAVTSIRVREALETASDVLATIAEAVRISAAVTLAAGALVLAGGVAASRRRHVYDAVVLKVLGASRRRIAMTFLLEYGILGAVAVLIATGIGTISAWATLKHVMALPWKFSFLSLAFVAVCSLTLTLLAGFFGTWQALSQKPAPWLRNQ